MISGRGQPGGLTEDVDVGAGQDGAVLVGGLALEHGAVLQLQVGQADLPGGDSPSEGPAWKTPDCVRSWRNAVTGEFPGSPHCVEAKGKHILRIKPRPCPTAGEFQGSAFASSPVA